MEINGIKSRYYTYTIDEKIYNQVGERFIAFDTETTGLNNCRIIELGAVIFEYGVPVKRFDTLINVGRPVPPEATMINHITTVMLDSAPKPEEAYKNFIDFIGDAAHGKTFIVCHNTDFDMLNLIQELSEHEYVFRCLDTLKLAKSLIPELTHHKLGDIAAFYGVINKNEHRACEDAEVCGEILVNMMLSMSSPRQIVEDMWKKNRPTAFELPYCKHIYNMLKQTGYDMSGVCFVRKHGLYVAKSTYTILEFKVTSRYSYAVVERREVSPAINLMPCSKAEGVVNGRLFLSSPIDLNQIQDYIVSCFKKAVDWTDNVYSQMYPENRKFLEWERSLFEPFDNYI